VPTCEEGACGYSCNTGWFDTNGAPGDGCEFSQSAEVCDGIDNDLNGRIDDGVLWAAKDTPCDGHDLDSCLEGVWVCDPSSPSGPLMCTDRTDTSAEICGNGRDDDCDGTTDEPGCLSPPAAAHAR
jgi:hypothetical protein